MTKAAQAASFTMYNHGGGVIGSYPYSGAVDILGASGTIANNSTITLSAVGLGEKAQAAPYYYNDFNSETIGALYNELNKPLMKSGGDTRSLPLISNARSFTGDRCLFVHYKSGSQLLNELGYAYRSIFPRVGLYLPSNNRELYYSTRVWYDWQNTIEGIAGFKSGIWKWARGGSGPTYSGTSMFNNTNWMGSDLQLNNNGFHVGCPYDLDFSDAPGSGDLDSGYYDAPSMAAQHWGLIEYSYKLINDSTGYLEIRYDNEVVVSKTGVTANSASEFLTWMFSVFTGNDSYNDDGGTSPLPTDRIGNEWMMYSDEMFVETGPQKIISSTSATFSGMDRTHKTTIHPASGWQQDQAEVSNADLSQYSQGETIYWYGMNENRQVNENGYPTTVVAG